MIREDDEVVYGDSGYIGIEKRPEVTGNEHAADIADLEALYLEKFGE